MEACPHCGRQLLEGPTWGTDETHFLWCLWCNRHWTLDGFEVVEPPEFWAGEAGLQWIRRWLDPTAVECFPHRRWMRWFREEWLELHPEG